MKFDDENQRWKVLDSKTIINRPWLSARCDRVELPDGRVNPEYYVLHYPTWINVIAETADGKIILERQYRHALGVMSTEICAGVANDGEAPLHAAQRELMEETGFGGGKWTLLMRTAPNPSTMDNLCYSYLAQGVERLSDQHLDATEDLKVYLVDKKEVLRMLLGGEFMQVLMIAPLWKYFSQYTDLMK